MMEHTSERKIYRRFRTNEILVHGFDDVLVLLRYLYMSNEHSITVDNGMCKLELTMEPSMQFKAKNLNFPDLSAMNYPFELPAMLAAIDQLKQVPATEYPDNFANRWEEVKSICAHNMTLNLV